MKEFLTIDWKMQLKVLAVEQKSILVDKSFQDIRSLDDLEEKIFKIT